VTALQKTVTAPLSDVLLPTPASVSTALMPPELQQLPAILVASGPETMEAVLEFFLVTIRNPNTRLAYGRAIWRFLAILREARPPVGRLADIRPLHVGSYIDGLAKSHAAPTAKQALAAIRKLGDWLVTKHLLATNPATSVKGPAHSQLVGSTPHLTARETARLFAAIDGDSLTDIRDRALIGVMAYTFARVSAVLGMQVKDVAVEDLTMWIWLCEKGGKRHKMPCHHALAASITAWLEESGLAGEPTAPLFPAATFSRHPEISRDTRGAILRLHRNNALAMVKRRALKAGIDPERVCNHTFRATGITTFLENGGEIENARRMAAHATIKTTQVYDRRGDAVKIADVERIRYEIKGGKS